jgi:predicted nucleic acid-binding protein
MDLVVDASVIVAVLTSEPERAAIVKVTKDANLLAPTSVHWEVGNALSAMIKRRRLTLGQAKDAIKSYARIPIRFVEVDLAESLEMAASQNLYAYDAYLLACAVSQRIALISLDKALLRAAKACQIETIEVIEP